MLMVICPSKYNGRRFGPDFPNVATKHCLFSRSMRFCWDVLDRHIVTCGLSKDPHWRLDNTFQIFQWQLKYVISRKREIFVPFGISNRIYYFQFGMCLPIIRHRNFSNSKQIITKRKLIEINWSGAIEKTKTTIYKCHGIWWHQMLICGKLICNGNQQIHQIHTITHTKCSAHHWIVKATEWKFVCNCLF